MQGSYVYQGCSHTRGAPMGGFSLQLGSVPSRNIEPPCGAVRAEAPTHAPSSSSSPTPSQPPPSIDYTCIFTVHGPPRLGVLISSTVPDTLPSSLSSTLLFTLPPVYLLYLLASSFYIYIYSMYICMYASLFPSFPFQPHLHPDPSKLALSQSAADSRRSHARPLHLAA